MKYKAVSEATQKRKKDTREKIELGGLILKSKLQDLAKEYLKTKENIMTEYQNDPSSQIYSFESFLHFKSKSIILGALLHLVDFIEHDGFDIMKQFEKKGEHLLKNTKKKR